MWRYSQDNISQSLHNNPIHHHHQCPTTALTDYPWLIQSFCNAILRKIISTEEEKISWKYYAWNALYKMWDQSNVPNWQTFIMNLRLFIKWMQMNVVAYYLPPVSLKDHPTQPALLFILHRNWFYCTEESYRAQMICIHSFSSSTSNF